MRIPVSDGPRVRQAPLPTPYAHDTFDSGLKDVAKSLQAVGGAVDAGVEAYTKQEKAKAEADGYRVDRADLLFGGEVSRHLYDKDTGFLNAQGERAIDNTPTLDSLRKKMGEIAEKELSDDEQRRRFMLRAERRFQDAWQSTERHTAGQRTKVYGEIADGQGKLALDASRLAGSKEEVDAAVGKVLVGPENEPGPLRRFLRAQGLPAEKVQAEENAFRAKAYGEALGSRLSAGDWRGAQTLFDATKGQLGAGADRFEKDITALRKDAEAEVAAATVMDAMADPVTGRVDPAKALELVDKAPASPEKDEVRRRVKERLVVAEQQYDRDTEVLGKAAYTAYNSKGWSGIPGPLKEQLNVRDPALYNQLRDDSERKFRERKKDSEGSRQEQQDRDKRWRYEFLALPIEVQAKTDLDRFLAGRGVSDTGHSAIKVDLREAVDKVQKGGAASEIQFLNEARAAATGIVKSKSALKDYEAEATLAYRRLEKAKGRQPSREETTSEIASLIENHVTPRFILPNKEEREFEKRARARKEGEPPPEPARAPGAAPAAGAPPPPPPKPGISALDRVKQLRKAGRNNAQIAETLTAEGYTKGE